MSSKWSRCSTRTQLEAHYLTPTELLLLSLRSTDEIDGTDRPGCLPKVGKRLIPMLSIGSLDIVATFDDEAEWRKFNECIWELQMGVPVSEMPTMSYGSMRKQISLTLGGVESRIRRMSVRDGGTAVPVHEGSPPVSLGGYTYILNPGEGEVSPQLRLDTSNTTFEHHLISRTSISDIGRHSPAPAFQYRGRPNPTLISRRKRKRHPPSLQPDSTAFAPLDSQVVFIARNTYQGKLGSKVGTGSTWWNDWDNTTRTRRLTIEGDIYVEPPKNPALPGPWHILSEVFNNQAIRYREPIRTEIAGSKPLSRNEVELDLSYLDLPVPAMSGRSEHPVNNDDDDDGIWRPA